AARARPRGPDVPRPRPLDRSLDGPLADEPSPRAVSGLPGRRLPALRARGPPFGPLAGDGRPHSTAPPRRARSGAPLQHRRPRSARLRRLGLPPARVRAHGPPERGSPRGRPRRVLFAPARPPRPPQPALDRMARALSRRPL